MKKHLIIKIITSLLLSLCSVGFAQVNNNNLPMVIPAAPNAAALSKYGNLDVGLQTGSLNFRMPLFNVGGAKWSLPIDIQYSTSGIKVDQIASRVGMGWALNAGGVITRSVNGRPDELNIRSTLPLNWTDYDKSFLDYLQNVTSPTSNLDTQPDDFYYNFNGYSGKFIFDASGIVMPIPHSNIKIAFLFTNTSVSSFVCTTPDGTQYYFEDMEFTTAGTGCGSPVELGEHIPTAWYITKIILPNKDVVNFTYQDIAYDYVSGISQTMTKSVPSVGDTDTDPDSKCDPVDIETTCLNLSYVSGKQLSNISFKYLNADFFYVSRQDIPASSISSNSEKLLSGIVLKKSGQTFKTIDFTYTYGVSSATYSSGFDNLPERYRAYLTSFNIIGKNSEDGGKYSFKYNDINGFPPRLSFSQDMQGYFNGKSNSSLVPKPDLLADQTFFWRATADRSPDLASTLKGSLIKINYPTGGSDSVVYSLNDHYVMQDVVNPQTASVSIAKTSTYPFVKSSSAFTPYSPYNINLTASALILLEDDGPDSETNVFTVEIIRQSDNVVVYTQTIKVGQSISNQNITLMNSVNSYVLRLTSLIPDVKCSAVLNYEGTPTTIAKNVSVTGLRVGKLISSTNTGASIIKKFYYSSIADLTKSSGNVYDNDLLFGSRVNYKISNTPPKKWNACPTRIAYSSSVNSLFPYAQNHIYYQSVVEGLGEDFDNGGTQHTYIIDPGSKSFPLHGPVARLGFKFSNNDFQNGLEREQIIFKKNSSLFVPVKKIMNSFKTDTSIHSSVTAYAISNLYNEYPQPHSRPIFAEFDGFQIDRYKYYTAWTYQDTSKVTTYDLNGSSPITSQTISYYNNSAHIQLTSSNTINSKGQTILTANLYPHEMVALSRDPTGVYQQMINDNIITPVIESKQYNNAVQTSLNRSNYYQAYTDKFAPQLTETQRLSTDGVESRIQFNGYDSSLNPLSISKFNGSLISYLWGYNKEHPIAEIRNATYQDLVNVLTQTVVDQLNDTDMSDAAVRTALSPLRSALPNAQVTTYTYEPLVGMTSSTDAKGITTYYEYDGLQRLINVKDKDGNIIKHTDYHYQNQ